jgi:hypothetical protein
MTTRRFLVFVGLWLLALVASSRQVSTQFETPNRAFHNTTPFRLEGRHQTVACEACHVKGQYAGTPTTCFQCHWVRRKDDRYQLRLGSECESCHRPTSWTAVRFNHAAVGGVPLGANHQTIACDSCHTDGQFTTATADCVSCHRRDYQAAANPNHVSAGFPTTCESCHRPGDAVWQSSGAGGGFSHAAVFPLVGVHATATCQSCHKNSIYKGTSRDCVGCHQANYNGTRNPNHASAGFPTTCDSCHRPTDPSWVGNGATTNFNHNAVFALVGTHATLQCASCHLNNTYRGTARDCAGCHLPRYNATAAPNHVAAGFPTTCESCHRATDASWQNGGGGGFNHGAVFTLVGTHAAQACTACHRNNTYRGTPRDCVGCHLPRYNATTAPNHPAAGFPTTCESCHRATDARWTGVTFNHSPFFALQGVHATQACASCHRGNVYRGTPRTCVGCHLPRYNATASPNHVAAGFPTTCESCHRSTDSLWSQGRFTHTQFPLAGRHNVPCAQCHTTANNYRVFSCTTCHTRSETDSEHRGRNGYVYESNACYSCHPDGRE